VTFALLFALVADRPIAQAQSGQTGLGVRTAIGNLGSLGRDNARNLVRYVTGNTYEQLKSNTNNAPRGHIVTHGPMCVDPNGSRGNVNGLIRDIGNIERTRCECKAWGSCSKVACDCSILCPDNLRIFDINRRQMTPTAANSLNFRNRVADFEDSRYSMTNGFCWGHSIVTQRFQRLAMFKPGTTPPVNKGRSPRDWTRYYTRLIDQIVQRNQATEIPGFRNLNELVSSDPALEEHFKRRTSEAWANQAMSVQGARLVLATRKRPQRHNQNLFNDIEERIGFGVNPIIVMTKEGQRGATHAVMAYGVRKNTPVRGSTTICINDSNSTPAQNSICQNKLILDSAGAINYSGMGNIGGIEVAHHENTDVVQQVRSMRRMCQDQKSCR
jgi:hypothetical protein